jgi:hypothetical protein
MIVCLLIDCLTLVIASRMELMCCFYFLRTFRNIATFRIVIQQLFNEIHVCQQHSSATVTAQTKFVQGITFREIRL